MSAVADPAARIASPPAEFWRRFRRRRAALVALAAIVAIVLSAIFAPLVAPYDPNAPDYNSILAGPSLHHLLGTDSFGRDVLSRIIYGGRISLGISVVAVALGGSVGVIFGLIAGYAGGWVDSLVMRVCDVLFAFPGLVLAIGVVAVLGPGISNVTWAVATFSAPAFARLVRGDTLALKQSIYVQAARSIGVSPVMILLRHVLPGALAAVIVNASLWIGIAIITAASLSFLGLGAQPPSPEWGAMLADGRSYLGVDDQVTLFPGLAILITVLAFNVLGDGLRDSLDQRLR